MSRGGPRKWGEGEVSFIQLSVNEASGRLIPRF